MKDDIEKVLQATAAAVATTAIKELLQNVGVHFLAGASLFAPYAFNQLKAAFGG